MVTNEMTQDPERESDWLSVLIEQACPEEPTYVNVCGALSCSHCFVLLHSRITLRFSCMCDKLISHGTCRGLNMYEAHCALPN